MSHTTFNIQRVLTLGLLVTISAWPVAQELDTLTDEHIDAILGGGSSGVFYAWSPHMPLSVDGLREILAAGEQLGLVVIPVLSSHANITYARDRIEGQNLPESVLRQSRSVVLTGRDLFVHAPAILIFDGGEFVSPVLPGFRFAADYESLIGRFLTSR